MKPRHFWICEDFLLEADEKGLIRQTPPFEMRGMILVQEVLIEESESGIEPAEKK